MIESLIALINNLSEKVPLEPFALFGGFIEEIIAPIPSPFIMMTAGSIVSAQGKGFLALTIASLLAAVGKTAGSWLIYWVSDKGEDIVIPKFGKWLGVTHKDLESIGKYFDKSWKDDLLLIFLRALPLLPGAPVSVVCGVIKIDKKTFLRSTFAGTFLRSLMFGYAGFVTVSHSGEFLQAVDTMETAGKIILVVLVLAFGGWFYYLREHGGAHKWIEKHFGKK